jgi:hypothetical protein
VPKNQLGDEGVKLLSGELVINKNLVALDLSSNEIG